MLRQSHTLRCYPVGRLNTGLVNKDRIRILSKIRRLNVHQVRVWEQELQ